MSSRPVYILDSNLFTLVVVATVDPSFVPRFKRTSQFDPVHARMLIDELSRASSIIVTPSVVAECSNLLNAAVGEVRELFYEQMKKLLDRWIEVYKPSMELTGDPRFTLLGLTDISLFHASRERRGVVLTADARMLHSIRFDEQEQAINFWHVVDSES